MWLVLYQKDNRYNFINFYTLICIFCYVHTLKLKHYLIYKVHHSIRRSLDSHDSVEVGAAIYAAQMFAAQSKLFAVSMCSKISDMIRGQATPASMKLQLIPILQYMHHDTFTASMVCKCKL